MGQTASKAVSRVRRAAAASKTSAALGGGSSGASSAAQSDAMQKHFLEQQQGFNKSNPQQQQQQQQQEMPEDLLKFLKDVGPLKKRETTDDNNNLPHRMMRTKREPRLPQHVDDDNKGISTNEGATTTLAGHQRRRESMPLAENIQGFETERTTNFSYKDDDNDLLEQANDIGQDILGLYSFLARRQELASEEEAVQMFYEELAEMKKASMKELNMEWTTTEDEQQQAQQQQLLLDTLKHMELPVILKDEDDSYVGVWPERVQEVVQLNTKINEMPKTSVKLVLEDLSEEQNEQAQQTDDIGNK